MKRYMILTFVCSLIFFSLKAQPSGYLGKTVFLTADLGIMPVTPLMELYLGLDDMPHKINDVNATLSFGVTKVIHNKLSIGFSYAMQNVKMKVSNPSTYDKIESSINELYLNGDEGLTREEIAKNFSIAKESLPLDLAAKLQSFEFTFSFHKVLAPIGTTRFIKIGYTQGTPEIVDLFDAEMVNNIKLLSFAFGINKQHAVSNRLLINYGAQFSIYGSRSILSNYLSHGGAYSYHNNHMHAMNLGLRIMESNAVLIKVGLGWLAL